MNIKKMLSIILAVAMTLSLCSCSSRSVIATYCNGKEVKTGTYLYYLVNLHNQYYDKIEDKSVPTSEWKIEGSSYPDFIEGMAKTYIARYMATEYLFEKYNLTIDKTEYAEDLADIDTAWATYGSTFEQNLGISKAAFYEAATNEIKNSIIQQYLYGEGGEKEISEEDLLKYFKENYVRVKYVSAMADEKNDIDSVKAIYEGYKTRVNNGEEIQEIIFEEAARQNGYTKESARASLGETFGIYFVGKDSTSSYPQEFIDEVFACEDSEPHIFNYNDYAIIIYQKEELLKDKEIFENSKENFIAELSGDEYAQLIADSLLETEYKFNEEVLEKYSFQKMFG